MVAQLLKANPGIDVSIDYLAVGRSSENDYIYADKARLAGPIAVAETPCTEKEQDN